MKTAHMRGPEEMCLQVTNSCPLRCSHCSTRGGLALPDELRTEEIVALIQDFAQLGGQVLELSGGEPLVHPDLREFVNAAREAGLEIRLYSSGVSGYLRGRASAPTMDSWAALHEAGLKKVFFNLQGSDEQSHSGITRIPGSFDAVTTSIDRARETGLFVGIHFVPMRPNYRLLRNTIKVAEACGVAEFAILRFVAQGRGLDNNAELLLTEEEFAWFLREAVSVRQDTKTLRVRLGCPFNQRILLGDDEDPSVCKAGVETCHIKSTGEVLPCSAFQQGFFVLGNVRERPLSELWSDGTSWLKFRELRNRGPIPGSMDFTLQAGDPCMAQIASGTERPLDLSLPPRNDTHQVEESQQN